MLFTLAKYRLLRPPLRLSDQLKKQSHPGLNRKYGENNNDISFLGLNTNKIKVNETNI